MPYFLPSTSYMLRAPGLIVSFQDAMSRGDVLDQAGFDLLAAGRRRPTSGTGRARRPAGAASVELGLERLVLDDLDVDRDVRVGRRVLVGEGLPQAEARIVVLDVLPVDGHRLGGRRAVAEAARGGRGRGRDGRGVPPTSRVPLVVAGSRGRGRRSGGTPQRGLPVRHDWPSSWHSRSAAGADRRGPAASSRVVAPAWDRSTGSSPSLGVADESFGPGATSFRRNSNVRHPRGPSSSVQDPVSAMIRRRNSVRNFRYHSRP